MKYISILIFLSLASFNCQEKNSFVTPTLTLEQITTPPEFISFDEDISRNAKFQPLYIGSNKKNIKYPAFSDYLFMKQLDSLSCQLHGEVPCTTYAIRPLEIWIDTEQIITHYGFLPLPPPLPPDSICPINKKARIQQQITLLNPIYSYPVFVYNNSHTHQTLGQFKSIAFDLEIFKNETWEVQQRALRGCGFDAVLLLPPNQIAITNIPIFQNLIGEKLRLNLNGNISNEFTFKK